MSKKKKTVAIATSLDEIDFSAQIMQRVYNKYCDLIGQEVGVSLIFAFFSLSPFLKRDFLRGFFFPMSMPVTCSKKID